MKVAILNDSTRTCVNTCVYAELPADTSSTQYQEITSEFNVSKDQEYGWTDATKTVRTVWKACGYFDEDGILCCDDGEKRTEIKEANYELIKEARKDIQFGWLRCCTVCDDGVATTTRDVYADEYNRSVINGAAPVVIKDQTLVETQFPEGLQVKTDSGVWYALQAGEVYPIYSGLHFTTQSLFNIEKEVQALIDVDYDSDMTTEDFYNKDYVTLATDGFDAKLETKIADATIFAQPITIEQVVM